MDGEKKDQLQRTHYREGKKNKWQAQWTFCNLWFYDFKWLENG